MIESLNQKQDPTPPPPDSGSGLLVGDETLESSDATNQSKEDKALREKAEQEVDKLLQEAETVMAQISQEYTEVNQSRDKTQAIYGQNANLDEKARERHLPQQDLAV